MKRINWDEIETSLREDVEKGRSAYVAARDDLDGAITPSGIPYPDGVLNVKNSGMGVCKSPEGLQSGAC